MAMYCLSVRNINPHFYENGTISDYKEIHIIIETEEDNENNVEDGCSQNEEVTNGVIGKGRNNKEKTGLCTGRKYNLGTSDEYFCGEWQIEERKSRFLCNEWETICMK